jgi:hypothetical protein
MSCAGANSDCEDRWQCVPVSSKLEIREIDSIAWAEVQGWRADPVGEGDGVDDVGEVWWCLVGRWRRREITRWAVISAPHDIFNFRLRCSSTHNMVRTRRPKVLPPQALPDLLQHLSEHADPHASTIIACTSRDQFLYSLTSGLSSTSPNDPPHAFLTPNLSLLSKLQYFKLAFCPDVSTLRAYLSRLSHANRSTSATPPSNDALLVLINPLQIHRYTPSFSAQGLGRTFAAAVSTSSTCHQHLVLVECQHPIVTSDASRHPAYQGDEEEEAMILTQDEEMEAQSRETSEPAAPPDPWEDKVPILDPVVARKWGGRDDRPWAGRTVSCRRIAERWAKFEWPKPETEPG